MFHSQEEDILIEPRFFKQDRFWRGIERGIEFLTVMRFYFSGLGIFDLLIQLVT